LSQDVRAGSSALGGEARRTQEIEIDVLVAHELATGSPAAMHIWKAAGIVPPDAPPTPRYQHPVGGRTADVMVAASGIELLIEDKAAGGRFQVGQPEAYGRLPRDRYRPVLIAPRSVLNAHRAEGRLFYGCVALEDLAAALEAAAPAGAAAVRELIASYRHRARQLRECASDPAEPSRPHPVVASFGDAYRNYVSMRNIPGVAISPGSMKRERTREVEFIRWNASDPGFQAYHKLNLGCVDFRVPGYRTHQLRWLLEAVPADQRLPPGWQPSSQQSPKAHAALRFVVPRVEVLDFDSAKPVVEQAVNAIANLRRWWDAGGARLLQGSSDAAIQWLVSHATDLARLRGLNREAEVLAGVARSLTG
jgi:hypothetical protein